MAIPAIAPRALKKGDTIAFVSPSSRRLDAWPWRAERAKTFLERQGYQVKIIHEPNIPYSPLSVNIAARVNEIHTAFRDPSVKAVVCSIGGSELNEILRDLDPEVVRQNPKIVSGGSDNTLFHHFCYVNGLRSFYGPSALTQLGEWPEPLAFTWEHFTRVLTVPKPIGQMPCSPEYTDEQTDRKAEPQMIADGTMRPRTMKPARGWQWLKPGKAEGELWGGCLPSLLQMVGTQWEVSYKGKIMFIELPKGYAQPLASSHFTLFRMNGILDQIVGLVVGRPPLFTSEEEQRWESELVRSLEGYDIPVVACVDVGHTDPMLTVPLGARVRLDSEKGVWEVLDAGVTP